GLPVVPTWLQLKFEEAISIIIVDIINFILKQFIYFAKISQTLPNPALAPIAPVIPPASRPTPAPPTAPIVSAMPVKSFFQKPFAIILSFDTRLSNMQVQICQQR